MPVQINIETRNAAFSGGHGTAEIARILKDIARRVEDGEDGARIFDAHGNKVGFWEYIDDCPDDAEPKPDWPHHPEGYEDGYFEADEAEPDNGGYPAEEGW